MSQSRQSQLAEVLALGPIIPVITLDRLEDAVPLARALVAGGGGPGGITRPPPAGAAAPA